MFELSKIIGLRVVTIRGCIFDKRKSRTSNVEPAYILFSDEKTFIILEPTDYYSYHDFDSTTRILNVRQDAHFWLDCFNDEKTYPEATEDIQW